MINTINIRNFAKKLRIRNLMCKYLIIRIPIQRLQILKFSGYQGSCGFYGWMVRWIKAIVFSSAQIILIPGLFFYVKPIKKQIKFKPDLGQQINFSHITTGLLLQILQNYTFKVSLFYFKGINNINFFHQFLLASLAHSET